MQNEIQKNLEAVLQNTLKLLVKNPNLRFLNTRKAAIWKYWQEFDGAGEVINLGIFTKLTNPETITRAIRYWVKKRPDLLDAEAEKERQKQAAEYQKKFQHLNKKARADEEIEILKIATQ